MEEDLRKPPAPSNEPGAFEALESDFQEVLQELAGDESLERFRLEYDKLHRALKTSHVSEKRLIKRCRDLNGEIVSNAAKVQTALKLSQEDQNTIASLKREIEKAWKMADTAHEKEEKAKSTIGALKTEIQNLSHLVEQGAGLSLGHENAMKELAAATKALAKARDAEATQLHFLKKESRAQIEKMATIDADSAAAAVNLATLLAETEEKRAEVERELARKRKIEAEVAAARGAIEEKAAEGREVLADLQAQKELASKREITLREERGLCEKGAKEAGVLEAKVLKASKEADEIEVANRQLLAEEAEREGQLKLRKDELISGQRELDKQAALCEAYAKKIKSTRGTLSRAEKELDEAKARSSATESELETARSEHERERKAVGSLLRERDVLHRQMVKAGVLNQRQLDQVRMHEKERQTLELEIAGYKADAQERRKAIFALERECDELGVEAAEAAAKHAQALDAIKEREAAAASLQLRVSDVETRRQQQQTLYDAVRADRNLYSKHLIDVQAEVEEMRRRFKIMHHQIEQLKEEVHAKDRGLVREHFDHLKAEKENELVQEQLAAQKESSAAGNEAVAQAEGEIVRLSDSINDAEGERRRQKKESDAVRREQEILGTQLLRRTDEITLVYEKIRICDSMLEKGEQHYRAQSAEVDELRGQIEAAQGRLAGLGSSMTTVTRMRGEIYQLQRELLQERTKLRALTEELEYPMNVHRWRKLESSDPETYELVQKIHILQKRLVDKAEEVAEKDLQIHQKDKLYNELKALLARQPGPEVAGQLRVYQQSLGERERQMSQMKSELSHFHTQAAEYKHQMGRLGKELRDVKMKYFEQKKKDLAERERIRAERAPAAETLALEARSTLTRFTGGGFNLSAPWSAPSHSGIQSSQGALS